MSKQISHSKPGIYHLVEQSLNRLFSPSNTKTAKVLKFVSSPEIAGKTKSSVEYHSEIPADEPKQRLKKEYSFSLNENYSQLKPDSQPKPEYAELKPEIKLLHTGFNVALNFSNNFKLPAKIYSRRGFEKNFKFLALDTFSPYIDNRPKLDSNHEEIREYQVIFFDENQEVGKMSEIASIKI
jgi:hypothetical protein